VTPKEIRKRLRDLLAGERTEEAAEEAERLLAELGDGEKRPPTPAAPVDEEAEERRRWARLVRRGGMSQVVWHPGRPSGDSKALVRDSFNPWR
jgi:hypothetical protein